MFLDVDRTKIGLTENVNVSKVTTWLQVNAFYAALMKSSIRHYNDAFQTVETMLTLFPVQEFVNVKEVTTEFLEAAVFVIMAKFMIHYFNAVQDNKSSVKLMKSMTLKLEAVFVWLVLTESMEHVYNVLVELTMTKS